MRPFYPAHCPQILKSFQFLPPPRSTIKTTTKKTRGTTKFTFRPRGGPGFIEKYWSQDKAQDKNRDKEQESLKNRLTKLQYEVTQNNATEPPFNNEYWDNKRERHLRGYCFRRTAVQLPLDKFDSGCGWPSFTKPLHPESITKHIDKSHNMVRTEVKSRKAGFSSGPCI